MFEGTLSIFIKDWVELGAEEVEVEKEEAGDEVLEIKSTKVDKVVEVSVGSSLFTGRDNGGYCKLVTACWSLSAVCEEPGTSTSSLEVTFSLPSTGRAALVWWSVDVGANITVFVTVLIACVWAVENDDGEDVDGSAPDTNDTVDERVVDRCDLEFSASSCEEFAREPCLPVVPVAS